MSLPNGDRLLWESRWSHSSGPPPRRALKMLAIVSCKRLMCSSNGQIHFSRASATRFLLPRGPRESGVNPLLPRNCEAKDQHLCAAHFLQVRNRSSRITHTLPRGKLNENVRFQIAPHLRYFSIAHISLCVGPNRRNIRTGARPARRGNSGCKSRRDTGEQDHCRIHYRCQGNIHY